MSFYSMDNQKLFTVLVYSFASNIKSICKVDRCHTSGQVILFDKDGGMPLSHYIISLGILFKKSKARATVGLRQKEQ